MENINFLHFIQLATHTPGTAVRQNASGDYKHSHRALSRFPLFFTASVWLTGQDLTQCQAVLILLKKNTQSLATTFIHHSWITERVTSFRSHSIYPIKLFFFTNSENFIHYIAYSDHIHPSFRVQRSF